MPKPNPLKQTQCRSLDEPTISVPATLQERERCASLEVQLNDNLIVGMLLDKKKERNAIQRAELENELMELLIHDPQLHARYEHKISEL